MCDVTQHTYICNVTRFLYMRRDSTHLYMRRDSTQLYMRRDSILIYATWLDTPIYVRLDTAIYATWLDSYICDVTRHTYTCNMTRFTFYPMCRSLFISVTQAVEGFLMHARLDKPLSAVHSPRSRYNQPSPDSYKALNFNGSAHSPRFLAPPWDLGLLRSSGIVSKASSKVCMNPAKCVRGSFGQQMQGLRSTALRFSDSDSE